MSVHHVVGGVVFAVVLSIAGGLTEDLRAGRDAVEIATVSRPSTFSSTPVDRADPPTIGPIVPEIRWALSRFESAGLELPELTIVSFDSMLDCDGHVGYYSAGIRTLHICRLDSRTVLHELAHAWADYVLTDGQRSAFAAYRHANGWNNTSDAWQDRATEQAAETIAWALDERERTVGWVLEDGTRTRRLLTIDDSSPSQLAEAYRRLTGMELPQDRLAVPDQTVFDVGPELRRARG